MKGEVVLQLEEYEQMKEIIRTYSNDVTSLVKKNEELQSAIDSLFNDLYVSQKICNLGVEAIFRVRFTDFMKLCSKSKNKNLAKMYREGIIDSDGYILDSSIILHVSKPVIIHERVIKE